MAFSLFSMLLRLSTAQFPMPPVHLFSTCPFGTRPREALKTLMRLNGRSKRTGGNDGVGRGSNETRRKRADLCFDDNTNDGIAPDTFEVSARTGQPPNFESQSDRPAALCSCSVTTDEGCDVVCLVEENGQSNG